MKILLATYWSIPHLGGVWNYLSQLKSRLVDLGHTVDIMGYGGENTYIQVSGREKTIPKERWSAYVYSILQKNNFPKVYLNHLVEYTEVQRYTYELAAAEFGLDDYDIIHTHDVISTVALDRARPEGVPLIATLHGLVSHEIRHQLTTIHKSPTSNLARAYFDEIERLGASSADVTITANEWLQKILVEEFGVPEDKFEKLHYGFSVERFQEEQSKPTTMQTPPEKKVIIYAGRLIELKGVHHLIDALASLKDRDDWVCWIVGDGNRKQHLQAQVTSLGLGDKVLFLGKREDVPVLLKLADISVLPSLMDNQPLSVIESQVSSKPVIVTDAGGLPEMVEDGVTGLIVPKGDVSALQGAIETLLEDDDYRRKLGEQAREWGLQHWSMDVGVERLLEIYKRFAPDS
jgi:glycosyltransferase involved in cell wall biosynthesis